MAGYLIRHGAQRLGPARSAASDWQPHRPDLILIENALVGSLWWQDFLVLATAYQPWKVSPIVTYTGPDRRRPRRSDSPWTPPRLYNTALSAIWRTNATPSICTAGTRVDHLSANWLDGVQILVVDDNDINLEVAVRLLSNEGCRGSNGLPWTGSPDAAAGPP